MKIIRHSCPRRDREVKERLAEREQSRRRRWKTYEQGLRDKRQLNVGCLIIFFSEICESNDWHPFPSLTKCWLHLQQCTLRFWRSGFKRDGQTWIPWQSSIVFASPRTRRLPLLSAHMIRSGDTSACTIENQYSKFMYRS